MKRFIVFFLILALVLAGCSTNVSETSDYSEMITTKNSTTEQVEDNNQEFSSFSGLEDEELLRYVENDTYNRLVDELSAEDYFIENVSAVYLSKEYIEELVYNSKSNVYFGYTVEELDKAFEGKKYVFMLGDDNTTIVKEQEVIDEVSYYEMLKNVAVGTGIILVCVTVSVATAGSAPAVSMIFAVSAKTATDLAVSGALISGVTTGVVKGFQTRDFNTALGAALMSGSEAFKWGAITGALAGGASETVLLKGATLNGLTMNEAAIIQRETKWPAKLIKQFSNMDDYAAIMENVKNGGLTLAEIENIWKNSNYPVDILKMLKSTKEGAIYIEQAGLTAEMINGQAALIRNIDLAYESELAGEMVSNLERMRRGYAAIDPLTGEAYQLHHIGQSIDSPLAILTQAEHVGGENNGILHDLTIGDGQGVHSLMSDAEWAKQRREFWKALAEIIG